MNTEIFTHQLVIKITILVFVHAFTFMKLLCSEESLFSIHVLFFNELFHALRKVVDDKSFPDSFASEDLFLTKTISAFPFPNFFHNKCV